MADGFVAGVVEDWGGKGEEVREKEIEKKLREAVKKRGGIAPKWVSPGMSGVPDRLILLPKSKIAFAETKAPGEKPRQLQMSRHRLLRRLGFKVFVIDRKEVIEEVLDEIEGKGLEKPEEKEGPKQPEEEKKEGGDAK